jgi:Zn-dependent protease with chaperone function
MRRVLVFLVAILSIAGCATTGTQTVQQQDYEVPYYIASRPTKSNLKKLCLCYGIDEVEIFTVKTDYPLAWADEKGIHLTEGLFQFGNTTISFIMAHELAHIKLKHLKKHNEKSAKITEAMTFVNHFIPGAGLLNHVINPAVMKQYSKEQEWEADDLAVETAGWCLDMPRETMAWALEKMTPFAREGGGFWDDHPALQERIDRIRNGPPH